MRLRREDYSSAAFSVQLSADHDMEPPSVGFLEVYTALPNRPIPDPSMILVLKQKFI